MKNKTANNSRKLAPNHTPTPWSYADDGFYGCIIASNGEPLFGGEPSEGRIENNEDTKFVLRAVNSHDELVKAVKELFSCYRDGLRADLTIVEGWRDVIAKAEGTL